MRRTLLLIGALLLVAVPAPVAAAHGGHSIRISRAGRIGSLELNVSSANAIERAWGAPAYTTTGNVAGPGTGYPESTLYGYDCRRQQGYTDCAIDFYVSAVTGRLESFQTTSREFRLFGGVRVGMSADLASARLHAPNLSGCGQGIHLSTRRLEVEVGTRGGHERVTQNGLHVSGGRVANIAIDQRRYGVGVLFC